MLARSRTAAMIFSLLTLVLFALAGVWVSGMDGYVIVGSVATDAVTNPFTRKWWCRPVLGCRTTTSIPG